MIPPEAAPIAAPAHIVAGPPDAEPIRAPIPAPTPAPNSAFRSRCGAAAQPDSIIAVNVTTRTRDIYPPGPIRPDDCNRQLEVTTPGGRLSLSRHGPQ